MSAGRGLKSSEGVTKPVHNVSQFKSSQVHLNDRLLKKNSQSAAILNTQISQNKVKYNLQQKENIKSGLKESRPKVCELFDPTSLGI